MKQGGLTNKHWGIYHGICTLRCPQTWLAGKSPNYMNIYKFYIEVSEWDNDRTKCGGFSSKSCLRTRKGNIGEKIPPGLES